MSDKVFVDTNIWLYAFMEDESEKHKIAFSIISNPNILLSTQAINEICINLINKTDYSEEDIAELVNNIYSKYNVSVIDKKTILLSSNIRKKYKVSYWDSLIIASAIEDECSIIYTEDMQYRQVIEGKLEIVNPFKKSGVEKDK